MQDNPVLKLIRKQTYQPGLFNNSATVAGAALGGDHNHNSKDVDGAGNSSMTVDMLQ